MPEDQNIKLINHIGVDLWAAAEAWKDRYAVAMVEAGYGYFGGTSAGLLQYIGPQGARPAKIAKSLGVSRQAVQQMIDVLESDGVVTRDPDPEDGRAKIVRLTAKGAEGHWRGNIAKAAIEEHLIAELGTETVSRLKADLKRVHDCLQARLAQE